MLCYVMVFMLYDNEDFLLQRSHTNLTIFDYYVAEKKRVERIEEGE